MLKPGDIVGPYEIRGFLGQGGMGQVFRAFDPRLQRTVALKIIVVPQGASPSDTARLASEFSTRLLREARAVASLSHPNVVNIFDVGEWNGRLYLAMEYVIGSTLRAAAEADVPRKLRWLVDVARALEAAHRAGLVHRDVKPENIMVRADGTVKVLDFGIARRTMASADTLHTIDTVTGGGSIMGTPVYMAPEQIKGGEVDARCDQFAWGVMAYELLAGDRPWSDTGDVLALVAKVLTEPAPPLRDRVTPDGSVPSAVESAIHRALAKPPNERFPTMADVADALEPFALQSAGGDRVRVTPSREDSNAFAATTRIPTSVSVVSPALDEPPQARRRTRGRGWQLAVPLALIATLAGAVAIVKRRTPMGPVSAPRPLSTVQEADTAYKDAMRLWHDGAVAKGRAALERAVALDPTFAAALLELAIQIQQEDPAAAQAAFQSAFEHRHMLVPRDSALLEASEPYVRPKPDLGEWETRMTSAVFQFPRDPELEFHLGHARERQGDDEGAKTAYQASLRLDPGFVPALAALASADRNLGHVQQALAETDRCLKQSPVASACAATRYRLLEEVGECHQAREQAAEWRTLEPQSPHAFAALARALHADGAPRPSVEQALARAWGLLPESKRASGELWDRMELAMVDGALSRAEALAREYEEKLAPDADQYDHAAPARVRMNVFIELDDLKAAAETAHAYLDRMDARPVYVFAPDPAIAFYEPLYRIGEITKVQFDERRQRWIEREKRRLPGTEHDDARAAWLEWTIVYGSFAETRDEAIDAIARMPRSALAASGRLAVSHAFTLGKVYALAGRTHDALPHLLRVTRTCSSFEDAMLVLRARYYLGLAYEAIGDRASARAAYGEVARTWAAQPAKSRTVKAAELRITALGR